MAFCTPSQGLGEAGMFLGSSVFFAIYDAVSAARRERGLTKTFTMNSPATPELIRMTCVDHFTDMVRAMRKGSCYNSPLHGLAGSWYKFDNPDKITGQIHLFQ